MGDLLRIGASGVKAYSTALAVVGENVSNAETLGYARRTLRTAESATAGATIVGYRSGGTGGVTVASIDRSWNSYKVADARLALSASARAEAKVTWLGAEEEALSNGGADVGTRLTAFYTSADALAADAGGTSQRQAFVAALEDAARAIADSAGTLKAVSASIATEARTTTADLNANLNALDTLNIAIARSMPGTQAQASLLDQRDSLVEDIAGAVDVEASYGSDGQVRLTLASDSSVALTGSGAARLTVTAAGDGRLTIAASAPGSSALVPLAGGRLGGLVEAASSIASRRATLDGLAADFASALNAWSAAGTDADGDPGGDLLAYDGATGAAGLTVLIGDAGDVPAAKGGAGNGNLLALAGTRTASAGESRWTALVTSNAQQLSAATTEQTTTRTRLASAQGALQETSGVDLDTEAAELLRYQQAYSAASKVISVARETVQAILDIL